MSLSLVVLAAGVGSRYGGPKQIDRVGPGGATLIDYSIYDARRAGFERAVLVVGEGREADMREAVGDRAARILPVAYAEQPRGLPPGHAAAPGRTKPWGTGLGLAISAGMAAMHGGTLRASNVPTGGAQFALSLPLATGRDEGLLTTDPDTTAAPIGER